jgi:hypothetical protein
MSFKIDAKVAYSDAATIEADADESVDAETGAKTAKPRDGGDNGEEDMRVLIPDTGKTVGGALQT